MKLARLEVDGDRWIARIEDDEAVLVHRESDHPRADGLSEALTAGIDLAGVGRTVELGDQARVLAPSRFPSKYVGVGLNYADHAAEAGMAVPERPNIFVKTANSLVGDQAAVRIGDVDQVDAEVELVIVIGRRIGPDDRRSPAEAILGFTVGNDITSRKEQFSDGQWSRAKSFDTFGPLGPVIVTSDELGDGPRRLRSWIDDVPVQDGTTADLIFSPAEIVEYLSRETTFEPGDLITTGTPAGVGMAHDPPRWLTPGCVVAVEIDGIGRLTNPVVAG